MLANMRYSSRMVKSKQIKFGGLAHYAGARDGELWDMRNLTSDHYPLLATRDSRLHLRKLDNPGGIFCWEKLCWVDGTGFYYDGRKVGTVTAGNKTFASLGAYIVILPDKCWFHVDTGEFGQVESTWTGDRLTFANGASGKGNVIHAEGVRWADWFRSGDTVSISGCSGIPGNNKSLTIQDIDGDNLIFRDGSFAFVGSGNSYGETGSLQIKRRMPDLDYLCQHENRLWGCAGDTIYASRQGDIFNWYTYDGISADSYAVDTGSAGRFTGMIAYAGYPIFLKENRIFKGYGSQPSDFQILGSATLGLLEGCGSSLAVAGETLFYLSSNGIMAYTGGVPQPVCDAFGGEIFSEAVAGSDGLKYYVSMKGQDGWGLYVFDTQKGLWHREDDLQITHFAQYDNALYMLDSEGNIWICGGIQQPEGATSEGAVRWSATFADFTDEEPNRKGFCRMQLRMELEEGASCSVWVQFDSDGQWRCIQQLACTGTKQSYTLPVLPQRADHYRIRLEGVGRCKIHSLTREFYVGSEIK